MNLVKMSQEDFDDFLSFSIKDYATDKIEAGTWSANEALKLSKDSFKQLLPDGRETKDEYLYSLIDDKSANKVGYLWVHLTMKAEKKAGFIYDFVILEAYRHLGYGTQALETLEKEALKLGIEEMGLHVFAHNKVARALYEKMGFLETDITMVKHLK